MGQILVIPGKIIFSQIGINSDNGTNIANFSTGLFPVSVCVVPNVVIGHFANIFYRFVWYFWFCGTITRFTVFTIAVKTLKLKKILSHHNV